MPERTTFERRARLLLGLVPTAIMAVGVVVGLVTGDWEVAAQVMLVVTAAVYGLAVIGMGVTVGWFLATGRRPTNETGSSETERWQRSAKT